VSNNQNLSYSLGFVQSLRPIDGIDLDVIEVVEETGQVVIQATFIKSMNYSENNYVLQILAKDLTANSQATSLVFIEIKLLNLMLDPGFFFVEAFMVSINRLTVVVFSIVSAFLLIALIWFVWKWWVRKYQNKTRDELMDDIISDDDVIGVVGKKIHKTKSIPRSL